MTFTTAEVSDRCKALKLPIPDYLTLEELLELDGEFIADSLAQAEIGDVPALLALQGIFYNLLPAFKKRLESLNMTVPPLATLVDIGRSEGPNFARALKCAVEEGSSKVERAEYVASIYSKFTLADQSEPGRQSTASMSSSHEDEPLGSQVKADREQGFLSYHVYGGKAAACFSTDKTRSHFPTIRIEATELLGGKSDWSDKIAIQVSPRELPSLLSTLLRYQTSFTAKGHGEKNEKWFSIENQTNHFFLSVQSKGKSPRALPVLPGDVFNIVNMIIGQMLSNSPFLTTDSLLELIRLQNRTVGDRS